MSAEELAAMDAKIVADTIAEMQRQIEQLTGARHSMYDPAVAIARDIANRTPPAMSADHIGEAQGWRDIPWRCFHCDETFTSRHCAAAHFGADETAEPACKIKGGEGGLLEALRRTESQLADAWHSVHTESGEAARAYYTQNARHREQLIAVEQTGYERGLADAQAHPETLGLRANHKDKP